MSGAETGDQTMSIQVGACWLDIATLAEAAAGPAAFELTGETREAVRASRAFVDQAVAQGKVIYGITTGFGALQRVQIAREDLGRLQHNLLVSHAVSTGAPLPAEIVRAMLLLRAHSLAQGYSGVREVVIERLLELLRRDLVPHVPALGSVGASGDLSPLSHMALPLIGEGKLMYHGSWKPAGWVLEIEGLKPLVLEAKEGLALNNGTQFMTATAALLLQRAERMARSADIVLALTLEALQGKSAAFDPRVHALRPHPGQQAVAENVRRIVAGSLRVDADDPAHPRVQDSYSVRCAPQVHGAARDTFDQLRTAVEREMNAVTDNPLVFADDGDVLSGGNFHGEPVAFCLDFLKLALAELGSISERRTAKLLDSGQNHGLPAFLVTRSGLNSGMMICQYTAAALVSRNKTLAHPDSSDSIPTSANQEDHVSMGANAALHAWEIADQVGTVLAIELLAAHYGNRFRAGSPGRGSAAALLAVAGCLAGEAMRGDEVVDHDFRREYHALKQFIESGALLRAVEDEVGALR
jgi:histidine ammonia-lyase